MDCFPTTSRDSSSKKSTPEVQSQEHQKSKIVCCRQDLGRVVDSNHRARLVAISNKYKRDCSCWSLGDANSQALDQQATQRSALNWAVAFDFHPVRLIRQVAGPQVRKLPCEKAPFHFSTIAS